MNSPKTPLPKKMLLIACLLLCYSTVAQVAVPFTVRYQNNLKGDMTLIANSIVNRQDATNVPNTPYNLLGTDSEFNDNLNMQYIDVDSDATTFNSSSASLTLPNGGCNKIVYAGLYWAATYRFNNGYSTVAGDGDNIRTNDFNQVRLKLPGGAYQNITGQIIFDGFTSPDFIANSPYTCYADITSLVTSLSNPEGEYTVANIRATQGFSNGGGVSGGWTIFFVYENPQMTGKFITSYDGFAGVRATIGQTDINYSGFTTLPPPFPVRAKLASGALEGDNRITGDQLLFRAASNATFTPLSNTLNIANNFFNSRITLNNTDFLARVPNSLNTLGYDADIITISNPLNSIIPNNETAATLRITSTQDTYFLYFNAFNIEVIEPQINLVKTVQDLSGADIGGQDVNLGQILDYVITFQNIGNDDATDATIRDILPVNTNLISVDLTDAPGVTYTHDVDTDELLFSLPQNLIEVGDPIYTIRIRVRVVETCSELEDACSNLIQNQAYTTYEGILNDNVISNDPSFAGLDSCGFGFPGPANFLVDIDDCIFSSQELLCGSSITLTAANGYVGYSWTDQNGTVIGNTQSITVSNLGTYTVVNTAAPPCVGITQTFTVSLFGSTQTNPIIPFADEVVVCPNDGDQLPYIFLCGANDSQLIQLNINDATSIVWEQLNESSCTASSITTCANENPSCVWNTVATGQNFTVTTAGQYRLTINYQDGCFTRFYFNVYTNLLDIQHMSQNIICNSPGSISITNLPANYQYQLVNQTTGEIVIPYQNNPTFSITTPGVYLVQIIQIGVQNGCVFEVPNIGIQQNNGNAIFSSQNTNCNGFGSITAQITGVPGQYTYTITSPINSSSGLTSANDYTFTNLNPGTYTVNLTTEDGCVFTQDVTILDQNNLALQAILTQNLGCGSGEISLLASGGTPGYSFAIGSINGINQNPSGTDFQTGNTFEITQPGSYTFIVVDANNCIATSNAVTVTVAPDVTFTTTVVNPTCSNSSDGSITYLITNSLGYTLQFQLLDANGSLISTNNSGIFTGLVAGNYSVILVQNQGSTSCSFTNTFTLTSPSNLVAQAGITQNFTCISGSGSIGIIPGSLSGGVAPYQFSLDGVTFTNDGTFTNLAAGTYTIIIKDANGCLFSTNPVLLQAPNAITDITFASNPLSCNATTTNVSLSIIGGLAPFSYEIVAPTNATLNNGNNSVFSNLSAGTYTFVVTDANGCTFQKNYTILPFVPINVTAQVTANSTCFNQNNGSFSFTVVANGNYAYTITNGNNQIIASSASTNQNTIQINNLAAGIYTIVVNQSNTNCSDTEIVTIIQPIAALSFTSTINPISCISNGSVTINANGGWGGYQYQLTLPNGSIIGYQSQNLFNNLNLAGNYIITVRDINGCIVSNTFNLATPNNPVATIASTSDLCFDGNGASITIAVTGGVVPYQYAINNQAFQASSLFSNVTPGSYTITVLDALGCSSTLNVLINNSLTASSALIKALDCSSSPNAIIETAITGGASPFSYQVSINGGSFGATQTIAGNVINLPIATAGVYQFLITDSQGCSFTTNAITINPLTQPEIVSVIQTREISCVNGNDAEININLNTSVGEAPYSFEIVNTTTGISYGNQTTGLAAGVYEITVTDANNCVDTILFTIASPSAINYTIATTDITCLNPGGTSLGEIAIQNVTGGTAPYQYIVTNNFGFTTSYITSGNENYAFPILNFGIYQVKVIDSKGCEVITDNIIIASPPNDLTIDVTTLTTNCLTGGTATITVSAAVSSGSYAFGILDSNNPPYSSNFQPSNIGTPESSTFTGLTPGVVYTFVVHDLITNCYYFKTAESPINSPSNVVASVNALSNVTCTGASNGLVSFSLTGINTSTTSITYTVFESQSNNTTSVTGNIPSTGTSLSISNIGPLSPGNYYVLFTEIGGSLSGCSVASSSFSITQSTQLLQINASVTRNDNCAINRGRITALAQLGTAPYQFQITTATATPPTVATWSGTSTSVFNVEGGNYIVYVKDANNCIQGIPVFVPTDPNPAISASISNLCNTIDGQFSVEVTVTQTSFAPYTFSINGSAFQSQNTPVFNYNNLTSGSYFIRIKDANNCIGTTTITIPAPLILSTAVTSLVSCADNDGEITATTTGGSGSYTYQLLDNNGVVLVNQNTPTFTGLSAGNYTVIVSDVITNCSTQANIQLNNPSPVIFTTTFTNNTCNGSNDGTIVVSLASSSNEGPYLYELFLNNTLMVSQNNGVFQNLVAGNYEVVVTSSRNCSTSSAISISEPTILAISTSTEPFSCNANNSVENAQININVSGGTSPYFFSLDGISYFSSNTFSIIDSGSIQNFNVTVRDANGCLISENVTINPLNNISNVLASQTTSLTCANLAQIEVNVNGGSGNYSFQLLPEGAIITPGNGVSSYLFTVSQPNSYIIEVTDLTTGCSFLSNLVTILPIENAQATILSSTAVTCFGQNNGSLTFSINNYNGLYLYEIKDNNGNTVSSGNGNTNTNPVTISSLFGGIYQVEITQLESPFCSFETGFITVGTPETDLILNSSIVNPVSCLNNSGEILAQASGGWGAYSYQLSLLNPFTIIQDFSNQNLFTNLASGEYQVTVRDNLGCLTTSTITLFAPDPITATIQANVTNLSCFGDTSASVSATAVSGGEGIYLYVLNTYNANGTSIVSSTAPQLNPVFSNLGSGIYSITILDGLSCNFTTNTVAILEPTPVTASLSLTSNLTCTNQAQLVLSATGGTPPYQYSQDGIIFNSTNTFSVSAGEYQFYVRDANNCATAVSNSINIPAISPLTITLNLEGAVINCFGENTASIFANASGGLGNYQYSLLQNNQVIQGPQNSGLFTNLPQGNYSVAVTSLDCIASSPIITITEPIELQITNVNVTNVLCNGGENGSINITTQGGSGIIQFAISPNLNQFVNNGNFNDLEPGNYTVIVQDQNGCFEVIEVTITEPQPLEANVVNVTQNLCLGNNDGAFSVAISGGTAPYSTSLNNPEGPFVENQTSFNNLIGGTDYFIFIRDANGCETIGYVFLNQPVLLEPEVAISYNCATSVAQNTVTITVNQEAIGQVTYSLDNGAFQSNNVFLNLTSGLHTVQVQHTNGCIKELSFTINDLIPIVATVNTTPISCNSLQNGSITINATGGNGQLEYALQPLTNGFSNQNSFTNLSPGNYTAIVRDNLGCEFSIPITITQPEPISIGINNVFPDACLGDNLGEITVSITGGVAPYSTSLSANGPFIMNQTSFENLSGNQSYTIYVRDSNLCTAQIAVFVDGGISINPEVRIEYSCFGEPVTNKVTIKVNQNIIEDCLFSLDGGAYQNSNVFTNLSNGNHSVTVLHELGCEETITFTIENYLPLTLSLTQTNINQLTALASGGSGEYTYLLNGFNYFDNVFQFFSTGTYTVKVIDSNGCETEATIALTFTDIDIPNFFTPNDDGNNDTWNPENMEGFPLIQVEVFDRYGRIIHKFGKKGTWDGTYNGNLLPTGDYWYTITLDDGRQIVGNVTLYR